MNTLLEAFHKLNESISGPAKKLINAIANKYTDARMSCYTDKQASEKYILDLSNITDSQDDIIKFIKDKAVELGFDSDVIVADTDKDAYRRSHEGNTPIYYSFGKDYLDTEQLVIRIPFGLTNKQGIKIAKERPLNKFQLQQRVINCLGDLCELMGWDFRDNFTLYPEEVDSVAQVIISIEDGYVKSKSINALKTYPPITHIASIIDDGNDIIV